MNLFVITSNVMRLSGNERNLGTMDIRKAILHRSYVSPTSDISIVQHGIKKADSEDSNPEYIFKSCRQTYNESLSVYGRKLCGNYKYSCQFSR